MKQSVAAIKRYRTKRLAALATRCFYLHKRGKDQQMITMLCDEFVALGGVYIKFLQGVLLQSKSLRKWQNADRLKIFENLDSEPLDVVELLRHELTPEQLAKISLIQPQAFAAGSFGQVYYGQMADGQAIIIKVLRPMVRELLKYDLRLLSAFSRSFFTKLHRNVNLKVDEALREFRATTLRETDYKHEANFADELYQAYKDNPKFIIPKTYLDLCTDNIIVQDYVPGVSVAQLVKLTEQGVDPTTYIYEMLGSDLDTQLQTLGYESLLGIFHLDRIQGDPHPGNVRLLSENRVGLIDFGISAQAPHEKAALYGMLEAYDKLFKGSQTAVSLFEQGLRFFVSDLYRALKKLASIYGKGDKDYLSEVSGVAAKAFTEVTGSDLVAANFSEGHNVLGIINSVFNKNNRFGLVIKLEASDILRAIQTYSSLVTSLGRYQQVVPQMMDRVVQDVQRLYPESINDGSDQIAISDAIDIITTWLERVAERDPALFRQLMRKIRLTKNPITDPTLDKETPAHA
ncbi:MAG: AarF/ABC1/UbiB kinase family protein [Candidatus Saccharimonadales bacterium]